jgi:hypothetical protein
MNFQGRKCKVFILFFLISRIDFLISPVFFIIGFTGISPIAKNDCTDYINLISQIKNMLLIILHTILVLVLNKKIM